MKILIASANPDEIEEAVAYGIHGIITNPTMFKDMTIPWEDSVIAAAAKMPNSPFHLQATELSKDQIVTQVNKFHEVLGERLIVKICINKEGLAAMQVLKKKNYLINITGVVTLGQAMIAVQAGADYISYYIGRAEKYGIQGMSVFQEIHDFIKMNAFPTKLVAASIQDHNHLVFSGMAGADFAACPLPVLKNVTTHPVTEKSILDFKKDWDK